MSYVSVDQAVKLLRAGGVVGLPTETVYGLAGRIDQEDALKLIFSTKQRPFFDPLIVHVASSAEVQGLAAEWPEIFQILAARFWPGPLTMVTQKTAAVSPLITSGLETVAIRCPKHPLALEVIRKLGVPVAAPSANRFGKTSPTRPEHVDSEFGGSVAVIDGGACEVGLESTVVDAHLRDGRWHLRVLRPGGVSRRELAAELQKHHLNFSIERAESAASPGHLKAHYQPTNPVVILDRDFSDEDIKTRVQSQLGVRVDQVIRMELGSEPEQAARRLYQDFRELSRQEHGVIAIRRSQTGPDWEAIWDRIERASSLTMS